MRYFVIADDGQKYGPADVATLQNWVSEGRLLATQQVEEEGSGIRMAASAINGLQFAAPPSQSPYQTPGTSAGASRPGEANVPSGSPYYRPAVATYGDDGKGDLTVAWICFGLGVFFCVLGVILQPIAIVFANKAISKGNPGGNTAKTLAIVFLVLSIVVIVGYVGLIGMAVSSGMVPKQTMVR